MKKNNGAIIYRGPSLLDGKPIVVIAVGFTASSNRKTGNMIQTYILRHDVDPITAIKTGADESICGDCIHRGDGTGKKRTCYVNIGQGALSVFKAYLRGNYPLWDGVGIAGRMVRLGTYGDPAAVPAYVWLNLLRDAIGHTGYTHQWNNPALDNEQRQFLQRHCMASADHIDEANIAQSTGWRTFRVAMPNHTKRMNTESICPASAEAGKKLTCETCMACSGAATNRRGSIVIQAHGGAAVMSNVRNLYTGVIA